ncbi:hypothetical protein Ahy_B09g097626 isoform B [Arachis hypogaea]|uniref:Uncharacterized protein n=1 Tax=Arachis hypogaea TaxID=3818 RepID=A0A444XPJ3_ARAHY|nr:hypothetical protein Ahy_B09g097626 isoform B [Arachis hypogaea]
MVLKTTISLNSLLTSLA